MAEWLQRATNALNALPVHATFSNVEWIVPAAQTVHILAISVVLSSSVVISLRAFSVIGPYWSLTRWQRRVEPWTAGALLVLLLSGIVMVLAEPERELLNSLFQIKMPLAVIAATITFLLGWRIRRRPEEARTSVSVKLVALLLLALWIVIMGLGRWIAYAG